MVRGKDACWEHCVLVDASRQKVRCNYCQREFSGGVYRMKFHLAQIKNKDIVPCIKVPDDVRDSIRIILTSPKKQKPSKKQTLDNIETPNCQQNSSSASGSAHPNNNNNHESNGHYNPLMSPHPSLSSLPVLESQKQDNADKKVALFFLHNAIPFNAAKSVYYQEMVDAIAECGVGYKGPTYEHMKSSLLERVKDDFREEYTRLKDEWKETGCTILCDCLYNPNTKIKSIMVFSVTSPKGTLFLKSADVSAHIDDAQFLYELIESIVLEVGIEDVIQVITDSTPSFVYAGRLLMAKHPSLFWSPCASHCINQILEDFRKQEWVNKVLEEGHIITTYIHSYPWSLNLIRKYTNGMELIRSKLPKSIVGFLSLRLLVIQEDNLKHMFSGAEWSSSQSVKSLLYSERFWKSANEAVSVSEPLIKILRIVEGDMPAMGYIYESMERVKSEIKAYYDCSAEKYMPIWEVIDRRWNTQLHSPLHAAAAFLNPSIIYSLNFKIDLKMRNGFQEAMMKMANEDKFKAEITKEHPVYLNAQGALGTEFAIMGRTINSPGDWWLAYGYEIPTLQRTAVRILSQPCSSHWCKWNWRTFQSVHAESRNGIEQEKFNDLAFVHCNLWLQAIVRRIHSGIKSKPISFNEIDVDSEWPVEFDCTASVPLLDDSWLDLFPLPIQSHSNRSGTP